MPDGTRDNSGAVLDERLWHVQQDVKEIRTRLDVMDGKLDTVISDHGERLARVETRLGLMAMISAALSGLLGYLGIKNP